MMTSVTSLGVDIGAAHRLGDRDLPSSCAGSELRLPLKAPTGVRAAPSNDDFASWDILQLRADPVR